MKKNMRMKYCVLVQTELAAAKYDYYEKPCFFNTLEEAKTYAAQITEEITKYPAHVNTFIFKQEDYQ